MAVVLTRAYASFASGATVILDSATESALIAQGLATAATGFPTQTNTYLLDSPLGAFTQGGNVSVQQTGGITVPTTPQGPRILPNFPLTAFASAGTNSTVVSGTLYRSEIFVPHLATWTGIGVLIGTTGGTDNGLVALYDSAGALVTYSALAGALVGTGNTIQNRAFVNPAGTATPVTLLPGRYFIAYQQNGATATLRTIKAVDGGFQMTASSTGTFGTLPASFTPPTTFTADVGPIGWLYQ